QLAASDSRLPPTEAAIVARLRFISAMPATWLNCAIWATIWVLSTGLNGSWVVSCVVISRRKSFWSIAPAPAPTWVGPVVVGRLVTLWALLIVSIMLIVRASRCRG